jgi:hypothetical protein
MLPSQDEFAALVAAYPDVPELPQSVPAEHAGRMIGIQPSSIRIPADGDGPRTWRLDTLVKWRASLPGRGYGAGRPAADIAGYVARLREHIADDSERLTVVRIMGLLDIGKPTARKVYEEFAGHPPVRGRLAGT